MSVRRGLLAILDQGPCYGYQLRSEYARRTGAALNVGQIYTTLDRLARDGLIEKRGADERGHVSWGLTEAGRRDVAEWFAVADTTTGRDERAFKIALAATLPGVDARALVDVERASAHARREALRAEAGDEDDPDVAASILRAAELARAEAEIAWLDAVAGIVTDGAFALSAERPKRGRPARTAAAGSSADE
jgi:DNA-binding PadR family transcriptional regulator